MSLQPIVANSSDGKPIGSTSVGMRRRQRQQVKSAANDHQQRAIEMT